MTYSENQQEKMPMAVILAGGRGKRMMPLTQNTPKPLLKVNGKEVLLFILENLEREGVRKALILTGYKGKQIEECIKNRVGEMDVYYLKEEEPKGSMGAVKRGEELLEDRFFVVCADAFGERRYRDFYRFHKKHGGMASVLLSKVKDPCEFGMVEITPEGRILAFKEKPDWSEVFSNLANTGIYLLEKEALSLVPEDTECDFGKDFFPMLAERNLPFYGFEDDGYWCDMGDPIEYLACNMKASGGASVIGKNGRIAPGSQVVRSVLGDGVLIKEDCIIEDAILADRVTVGRGCRVSKGCILADDVILAENTSLAPGSVLSNSAEEKRTVSLKNLFSETVLHTAGVELPAFFWASFGEALGKSGQEKKGALILVSDDGSAAGKAIASEIGMHSAPFCVTRYAGSGFYTKSAFLAREYGTFLTAFVYKERIGGMAVALFDENGLPPGKERIRKIRDTFEPYSDVKSEKQPEDISKEAEKRYESALHACFSGNLNGMVIGIGRGKASAEPLLRVISERGAVITGEGKGRYNVYLSPDGRIGEIYDESGRLDRRHLEAALLYEELRRGEKIDALPYRVPAVFFEFAENAGSHPVGFSLTPAGTGLDEIRKKGSARRYLFDGLAAVLGVLGIMAKEKKNCREMAALLPSFAVAEQVYDCAEGEKLALLLSDGFLPAGEGVQDRYTYGRIRIRALGKRGLWLMAEAGDDNDAGMLLSKIKKKLNDRKIFEKDE